MDKLNKIIFSIIIPVYNAEDYLDRCINSILSNRFSNYEIIIVNDGSTDNSDTICKALINKCNKIKYFYIEHSGLTHARNFGIKHSLGEYILYVDADDYVSEVLLEECYNVIDKHKNLDILFFDNYQIENNNLINRTVNFTPGFYSDQQSTFSFLKQKNEDNYFTSWAVCYKHDLISKYYCKDERIAKMEDFAYVQECLLRANNFYYLNKSLYYYVAYNKNSMTTSTNTIYDYALCYSYIVDWIKEFDEISHIYVNKFLNDTFIYIDNSINKFNQSKFRLYNSYKNMLATLGPNKLYCINDMLNDVAKISAFCLEAKKDWKKFDKFSLKLLVNKKFRFFYYYRIFIQKIKLILKNL